MHSGPSLSRRRWLAAVGGGSAAALVGCLGDDGDDGDGGESDGTDDPDDGSTDDAEDGAPAPDAQEARIDGDWSAELGNAQRNPVVEDRAGPLEEPVRRWSRQLEPPADEDELFVPTARPVVADGTAFAQSVDGTVLAVDVRSGDVEWEQSVPRAEFDPPVVTPTVTDAGLFVASQGVRALATEDGEELWHYEHWTEPEFVAASGDLVLATDLTELVALDAASGEELWVHGAEGVEVRSPGQFAVEPEARRVFVPEITASELLCLDAADGAELWTYEPDVGSPEFPVLADGTVYVASATGSAVEAVDATDGTLEWSVDATFPSLPAVTDESVVVAAGTEQSSSLRWLDRADGSTREEWTLNPGTSLAEAPVVTGDAVLAWLAGDGHSLVAMDRESGEKLWSVGLAEVADGFAVTGTHVLLYEDGELVALGPE